MESKMKILLDDMSLGSVANSVEQSLHCASFEGTVQQKLCLDKWHEILIGTIRQFRNAKKFRIPTTEI